MISLREYKKGDIQQVLITNVDRFVTRYVNEDAYLQGISYTGIDKEGKIVGCAGLIEWWDGVYEAWLAVNEECKKDFHTVIGICKYLRISINSGMKGGIRRVHAFVNTQIPNHEHFMKFLGFEKEAVIKEFFPNRQDAILYRRLN